MPSFSNQPEARGPAAQKDVPSSDQRQLRISALIAELKDPAQHVIIGPDAHDAAPALVSALKDSDGDLRSKVVDALSKIFPNA